MPSSVRSRASVGVEVVAEIFVGGAAQQADHQPARRHGVEHRQFLGDADRVADCGTIGPSSAILMLSTCAAR